MKKIVFLALFLPGLMLNSAGSLAQSTTERDALTFMLSNESPGYLIDNLIANGYGDSCLYALLVALQPSSGGIISDDFLDKLAVCPANSDVFTTELYYFSDPSNNPVGIGEDGNLIVAGIYGRDYSVMEGYTTYNDTLVPVSLKLFTKAIAPGFYIDAGTTTVYISSVPVTTHYKAFAIAWAMEPPTTFVLSNEGGLIDDLIRTGNGDKNLYQTLEILKPKSGGVISDEFMSTLANCPAESEIFTAPLSVFGGLNNPVCVNSYGTLSVNGIFGKDYIGKEGYATYPKEGDRRQLFTYSKSPQYYIDAGSSNVGETIVYYKAFAIAWSNYTTPKTITVTADSGQSKESGSADPVFTYTVQPALDTGDSFTGALSREPGENPGTYAITLGTLSAGAEYDITFVSADFTINQVVVVPTTFVLSNEAPGKLIDRLIAAGHGNSSLYEVMVALKPASGGVLTDEFLSKLASCPVGSEIFTATLSDVSPPGNNPIGINTDGTLIIVPIYGADYFQREGWDTYTGNQPGIGIELFTFAESPLYYIDAGTSQTPGVTAHYQAFAIAWSNSTDGISVTETNPGSPYAYPNPFTDGFYIHNLPENTRLEIFDIRGKLLYQKELKDSSLVQPGILPGGIYFLKLINSQGIRYQKIVKY